MKRLVLAVALLALTVSTHAQSAIAGRVVSDDSGFPIPNARVVLNTPARDERKVVLSDNSGRFTLRAAPGNHNILVTKTRFAQGSVTTATWNEPIEIRLRRAAAISGRIINELGDPVVAARVTVETHGKGGTIVGGTTTDDRGEYRVGGLSAGTFTVAVTPGTPVGGEMFGFRMPAMTSGRIKTFYPNASEATDAPGLQMNWGDEQGGIDFVLPLNRAGNQPFDIANMPSERQRAEAMARSIRERSRPLPPTSVIRGRVSTRNGTAVPYARVRLDLSSSPARRMALAGAGGDFEFADVSAGTHVVSASRVGFFNDMTFVEIKADEIRDDVAVTLDPWGVVAGRVLDEHGDPLQGAKVEVLRIGYEAGRRRLVPARAAVPVTETDDLGSYRLFGLRPGQYMISAEVGSVATADLPGYARTLFPGTAAAAEAQFITIGRFPEVGGMDFAMARAPTARITGRFVNTFDQPAGGSLMLMPSHHSLSAISVPLGARIFSNGMFEFPNVPPGDYVIQAYRDRKNPWTEGEFGATRVTVVDSDVEGVIVRTSPGSSIRGRVSFDATQGTRPPSAGWVGISPIPVDPDLSPPTNLASANISFDGSFMIDGINGPRRLEVLKTPPGWSLKEIRVGGIDMTDRVFPFGTARESLSDVEVVFVDRVNEVFGNARDDRARAVPNASVIVFPADRSFWYPRSRFLHRAFTDPVGSFIVSGLPAGSYYVAAGSDAPGDGEDAWQEPVYLESLISRASTILLGEGQRLSVNPRVGAP